MQANGNARDSPESQAAPGVVELREDVPLKSSFGGVDGARLCAGGPRFILACFAVLTVAITLALLTQIYYGDYQVVPHGSVSSSAAACSRAGTDALKSGGRAIDAAVAAALCLAVSNPHRTSLDASGALVYWEYGQVRALGTEPGAVEWGGPDTASAGSTAPRLVAAMAGLHARLGALPWPLLLEPAIRLARYGFIVSEGLALALAQAGEEALPAGANTSAPHIADYLESLQHNTSAEWSAEWGSEGALARSAGVSAAAGAWRVVMAGAGAAAAGRALRAALQPPPLTPDEASRRTILALQGEGASGTWPPSGVGTGLAVVDQHDTYLALVTGLSKPFGSGPMEGGGWRADVPSEALDLAPAIMVQQQVCGTRYVMGAESSAALAQGAAALALGGPLGASAVEAPRVALLANGALGAEALRPPPPAAALPPLAVMGGNASLPYAALNVVQQRSDALLSHADSRGGGLASRF